MSPKRDLDLGLTPKGQAVLDAMAKAQPVEQATHGIYDIVCLATCECGQVFDGNGSTQHALALLDAHLQENDAQPTA